jgi:hypothetical protein
VDVALAQGAYVDVVIAIEEHLLSQHVLLAVLLLIPLIVIGLIRLSGLNELPCEVIVKFSRDLVNLSEELLEGDLR